MWDARLRGEEGLAVRHAAVGNIARPLLAVLLGAVHLCCHVALAPPRVAHRVVPRYCMVPFAKAICPVVDARAKTLQVAPPEGLLDLWTTQPLKKVRFAWL